MCHSITEFHLRQFRDALNARGNSVIVNITPTSWRLFEVEDANNLSRRGDELECCVNTAQCRYECNYKTLRGQRLCSVTSVTISPKHPTVLSAIKQA